MREGTQLHDTPCTQLTAPERCGARARPLQHFPQMGVQSFGYHLFSTLTRVFQQPARRPIRREVERLLEAGQTCGVPKTDGACREILKLRQALWTFVRHAEVEPTNNAAERAMRPGVLWRKGSFGTQSADGSRVVEAIMTQLLQCRPADRP
jgi:Transposase IS66 family